MSRPLAAPERAKVAARLARAGFPAAMIRSLLASEGARGAADELLLDGIDDGSAEDEPGVLRDAED
ncbi:MAG: hypothetical protein H6Q01_625 [Acidobacteria bacterium]|nr:hypothetical protein [Acidobacteriota bacterium]